MKKTMIALVALSGLAMADTTTSYDLLSTTDGWTMGSLRNRAELFVIDTDNKSMSLVNSNWSQSYAIYDFGTSPLEASENTTLTFSFTMQTADAKAYTLALIGSDTTIVVGEEYDNPKLLYGTTDTNADAKAYGFGNWGADGYVKIAGTQTGTNKATNTPITLSGTSAYDATTGTYSLKLNIGGSEHTITGLDKLDITKLSFSGDGQNNLTNVTISALTLTSTTTVPEPATATLSLLALAGLASRRRRH